MISMIEQRAFEAVAEIPRALRAIEQRLGGGPREGEAPPPPLPPGWRVYVYRDTASKVRALPAIGRDGE